MLWMYRYDFHQAKKRCSNENDGDSFGRSTKRIRMVPKRAGCKILGWKIWVMVSKFSFLFFDPENWGK